MSKIQEIIVAAILPTLKVVGKIEMKDVLQSIRDHNKLDVYHNTLQGIYSSFSLLKEATRKTKTQIDDGIVDLVLEAVQEQAQSEGLNLSVTTIPE